MSDRWFSIETAPREEGARIIAGWENGIEEVRILRWKTNYRIVSARKRGEDVGMMEDSYFGDLEEDDDYWLSEPKNFPTHWMPYPCDPK